MNSAMVQGFDKWKDWQAERRMTRSVLAKALTRMMNMAFSAAFYSWKEQVNRSRKLRAMEDRSCYKTVSSAFRIWRICNMTFEILCAWKNSFLSSQLFKRKFPSRIVCFHRWILFVVQCKQSCWSSQESFLHKSRSLQYIYNSGSACQGAGVWRLWPGDSVGERKTVVRLCDLSDSSETSDLLVPAYSHMRTLAQPHHFNLRNVYAYICRLLQMRSFITWSACSLLKQGVHEEPLRSSPLSVMDLPFEPVFFWSPPPRRSPPSRRKTTSLRASRTPHTLASSIALGDDDDVSCVQRALLSSYQRLDAERLRRRVVLGWAAVTTPTRLQDMDITNY